MVVLPQFGGLRDQRHEVQPEGSLRVRDDGQPAVHRAVRLQLARVLLPILVRTGDRHHIGIDLSLRVFEIDGDRPAVFVRLQVQAQVITHTLLGGNGGRLRIVGVQHPGAALVLGNTIAVSGDAETGTGIVDVEAHAVLGVPELVVVFVGRIEVVPALQVLDQRLVGHGAGGAYGTLLSDDRPAEEDGVALGELIGARRVRDVVGLERVVLDELGADAAIDTLVDVLEENARQRGADGDAEPVRRKGQCAALHRLDTLELQHLFRHAVTHQAHAFGAEMELVARALAAQCGDDIGIGHDLRQMRQDHLVEGGADTIDLSVFQLAREQRNRVRVDTQIGAEVVMDLLHAPRPGGVVRVGLALVQQHALDHADRRPPPPGIPHRRPCPRAPAWRPPRTR